MPIIITIKQKSLFKNKLEIESFVQCANLGFGYMDEQSILKMNQFGKHMLLYNPDNINCGFYTWIENNAVKVRLNIPSTPNDIDIFYDYVKLVCKQLKVTQFIRNGAQSTVDKIDEYRQQDNQQSCQILNQLINKFYLGMMDSYLIFGAYHVVVLGQQEIEYINGDNQKLEQLLHEKMTGEEFYVKKKYYRRDIAQTYFAVYSIAEERPMILPKDPLLTPFKSKLPVVDFYVALPYAFVKYKDFMDHVDTSNRYDELSVVVTLDSHTIDYLQQNYGVDTYNNPRKVEQYTSHVVLDSYKIHQEKANYLRLNVPPENIFTHMAIFLLWAYGEDMLTDEFIKNVPCIENNPRSLNKEFLINPYLDKSLLLGYFKEEYHPFIKKFYRYVPDVCYPGLVDYATMEIMGEKEMMKDKYLGQAYLFMEFNNQYIDELFLLCDYYYQGYQKTDNFR